MADTNEDAPERGPLKRTLGLPLLTLYGLGTMVGGGFYALVGKVAGEAGMGAPVSFLTAAIVAGFSALSFGELSARYPVSAGESFYVQQAFDRRWLSAGMGWLVILTGVVSAATLVNAFVAFLGDVVSVPDTLGIIAVTMLLGSIAMWGIVESAAFAVAITFVEVSGLLFVVVAGRSHLLTLPERWVELAPPMTWAPWPGILLGAFLGFYSLIGCEDMVNLAEEVKNPRRNLPRAIVLALAGTTILYVAVTSVAVLSVSPEILAVRQTPLAAVLEACGYSSTLGITLVSMLAGINGALVQLIMASRVTYGMAGKGMAPSFFASVSGRTHTPIRATILAVGLILGFSLWLPLVALARLTSGIILVIFAMVNVSLIVLKRRGAPAPVDAPSWPVVVPAIGFAVSVAFLAVQIAASLHP